MDSDQAVTKVEREVARALRDAGLTESRLVPAVSGGPDSLALFHALLRLRAELGLELHGAHLDHGLRGDEGRADARFVAGTFLEAGIGYTVEAADVGAYQRDHKLSVEEAARDVRYDFLGQVAADQEADTIALGHTSDDQAETVLMHVVRGSGLTGLRGMEPVSSRELADREVKLVRPILELSRADTLAYCEALSLEPRLDASNLSDEYTRNRVRNALLPVLEELNPSIRDALVRLSRAASQDLAHLDETVDSVWDPTVSLQSGRADVDRNAASDLSPAVLSHLLRRCIEAVKGDLNGIAQVHVDAMTEALNGDAGKSLDLPEGLTFEVGYDTASIVGGDVDPTPLPPIGGSHAITVPGTTGAGRWTVTATLVAPESASPRENVGAADYAPDGLQASFDADAVSLQLVLRARLPGDRFQPLGMTDSKKVQDFMVDSKVPRRWRDRVPIIEANGRVLWVAGWRIADWAKVTAETERVLVLALALQAS